jgi:hypothetical protein
MAALELPRSQSLVLRAEVGAVVFPQLGNDITCLDDLGIQCDPPIWRLLGGNATALVRPLGRVPVYLAVSAGLFRAAFRGRPQPSHANIPTLMIGVGVRPGDYGFSFEGRYMLLRAKGTRGIGSLGAFLRSEVD